MFTLQFFRAEKYWWSAEVLVCQEKKRHTRVFYVTKVSWQGPLYDRRCSIAFTICFLFELFFLLLVSIKWRILSLMLWLDDALNNDKDPLSQLWQTDVEQGGCRCMTLTNTNTQTGSPLSVMIVFVRHILQLRVHGDGQHQLLLHLQVLTDLPLAETTQHNDLLLVQKKL